MAPPTPGTGEIQTTLASLRDAPVNSDNLTDAILNPIFSYLMSTNSSDTVVHWFCNVADDVTREAATFLLRLYAYRSSRVDAWKARLRTCLSGCIDCVQGLQGAKVDSKHTYFGAFAPETVDHFFMTFGDWEITHILDVLSRSNITPDEPKSLSNVSSVVVYHMLSNPYFLKDDRMLKIINAQIPSASTSGWPTHRPPVGILYLAMHENAQVRQWARNQIACCRVVPLQSEQFTELYRSALRPVILALTSTSDADQAPTPNREESARSVTFGFAKETPALWSGFTAVLRLVPSDLLRNNRICELDLRQIVIGHLHDVGTQFADVLRCLVYLLKRQGSQLWSEQAPDYPQVVFDAIKDNPSFLELVATIDHIKEKPWFLDWISDYLESIWDSPVFGDVLAKVADFMCEELQHERFKDARPTVMSSVLKIFDRLLLRCGDEQSMAHHRLAMTSVFDIHSDMLVSLSFARSYRDEKWKSARQAARGLLRELLLRDARHVAGVLTQLSHLAQSESTTGAVDRPSIRKQIWKKLYDSVQANDSDGIAMLIHVTAASVHIDLLNKQAFAVATAKFKEATVVYNDVNQCLQIFRDGFLTAISRYTDHCTASSVLNLLRRQNVAKDVLKLMMSPIEDIRAAAQALVGQAFDVDVRIDCFRALLENLPTISLEGITSFLETFNEHVKRVPEACSLSRSVVRCLTDIIDVLCSSADGLLRNVRFMQSEEGVGMSAKVSQLWTLMAHTIGIIFKLTPVWASYFENGEMTVWMRDALIFGRDMLAQRRVMESGALSNSENSTPSTRSKRLSQLGKKMMDELQDVLIELARWLRLTDQELLHQSFSLLQSLLNSFQETGVPPSEPAFTKLRKFISDAKNKNPKRPQTRLDSARLSQLENALAVFDGDSDVELVSESSKRTGEGVKSDPLVIPSKTRVAGALKWPAVKQPSMAFQSYGAGSSDRTKAGTASLRDQIEKSKSQRFKSDVKPAIPVTHQMPAGKAANSFASRSTTSASSSAVEISDSESSESDDEGPEGLAALGQLQRSPKIKRPAERRQVKMLDLPTNGRFFNRRFNPAEEARRTAQRLRPDISPLHRTLLSWDYDQQSSEPPMAKGALKVLRVPDRFHNFDQYQSIFEPLLLFECWAQIMQSKEETTKDVLDCRITSRAFVDDWLDIEIMVSQAVKKDWFLSETDVVLLRRFDSKKSILAKAQNYRTMPQGIQATVRCFLGPQSVDPGLQINSTWQLTKVFSLSTLHREYAALRALPYYDFSDFILRPQLPSKPILDSRDVRQTMSFYNVNEPQAIAILSSLQTEGFTLIQGPPGTGKTSTICGLVQAFLSRRQRPTTAVHAGRNAAPADKAPVKKILLCAPSNAAVDEIAYRLRDGVSGAGHRSSRPNVVRVGADKAVNASVKDITLDYLVDQKLNADHISRSANKDSTNEISLLRTEIESVKRLKQQKQDEISAIRDNTARTISLEDEIKKLNSRRMTLTQQMDRMRDKQKSDNRTLDATRRRFRNDVLAEADIVCSTLSGAGHEILEQFDFDMVIIDEAAQAIELSSLIPLRFKWKHCVMVGDPQQLPPTVISQEASRFLYNQSLFVRLQKERPDYVHLLSIQYRMHPEISRLPSRVFYEGRLEDGPDMAEKTKQPWHTHPKFGVYRFFNVARGQEQAGGQRSLINKAEIQVATALYNRLRSEFSRIDFDFRIGVVSMYRAQIVEMRRAFEQRFGADVALKIDFNTVDGFQGQEKDIIILSCVRAGYGLQSVGFLSDIRRMNVSLTRAKSSLFVLGHAATLERSDVTWRSIVSDARSRSCLLDVDASYFTTPAGTTYRPPSPSKDSHVSAPGHPAIPPDLLTPKDYKASKNQNSVQKATESSSINTSDNLSLLPGPNPAPSADSSKPQVGVKRRRSIEEARRPAPANRQQNDKPDGPKPKPPVKRPKQAPSIFIPKQKRGP